MTPQANAYIAQMRRIPGWLTLNDATAICAIDEIQQVSDLHGHSIIELGVYRGMSLGLLLALARPDEDAVIGIDLFGDEPAAAVEKRLREFVSTEHLHLMTGDSRAIEWGAPGALKARLIHIDAGHEYADVAADIALLAPELMPAGVMVIDDYFDKDSPGVAMATTRAGADLGLTPFLCGENKMFLCRDAALPFYLRRVLETDPFKSRARIQTLPSGPIIVGFPNKPHETARMVEQVREWAVR